VGISSLLDWRLLSSLFAFIFGMPNTSKSSYRVLMRLPSNPIP
jgi:hypothetical protein